MRQILLVIPIVCLFKLDSFCQNPVPPSLFEVYSMVSDSSKVRLGDVTINNASFFNSDVIYFFSGIAVLKDTTNIHAMDIQIYLKSDSSIVVDQRYYFDSIVSYPPNYELERIKNQIYFKCGSRIGLTPFYAEARLVDDNGNMSPPKKFISN